MIRTVLALAVMSADGRTEAFMGDIDGEPANAMLHLPFAMLDKPVTVRSGIVQLVGLSHANQVNGYAATVPGQLRHDIPPEIGRGGITVLKHDGITRSEFHVGHLFAMDFNRPGR